MHIAVRRYKTDPKLVAQALFQIGESFLPVLKMTPGFIAYYAFPEGDGALATVSVFRDRESAEASTQSAAKFVKLSLSKLLPEPPEVFHGPVACSDQSSAPAGPARQT